MNVHVAPPVMLAIEPICLKVEQRTHLDLEEPIRDAMISTGILADLLMSTLGLADASELDPDQATQMIWLSRSARQAAAAAYEEFHALHEAQPRRVAIVEACPVEAVARAYQAAINRWNASGEKDQEAAGALGALEHAAGHLKARSLAGAQMQIMQVNSLVESLASWLPNDGLFERGQEMKKSIEKMMVSILDVVEAASGVSSTELGGTYCMGRKPFGA